MGLCSYSTSYYGVFGPCLDISLIPVSVLVYPVSFSSYQDRVGVGLRCTMACPHLIMIGVSPCLSPI